MAILTVVVGLLLVTCAFLIGYGFCAGQNDIELRKSDYLAQVAETGAREVFRLPETAANVLRVQRFRRPAAASTPSPPNISAADPHPQPEVADQSTTGTIG